MFCKMQIKILKSKLSKEEIKNLADASFGGMLKIVIDVKKNILAVGGEFHADGEELLLKDGSEQENLWGANYYPLEKPEKRIEYSALINIRPQVGNRTMYINDDTLRQKIKFIVESLLLGPEDEIS